MQTVVSWHTSVVEHKHGSFVCLCSCHITNYICKPAKMSEIPLSKPYPINLNKKEEKIIQLIG
jgi:hypothetical protein